MCIYGDTYVHCTCDTCVETLMKAPILARTILRNVVEDGTPYKMLSIVVDTLLGENEYEMMSNYTGNLHDALCEFNTDEVGEYVRQSALLIDGWIENYLQRYSIASIKMDNLVHRLTDEPDLIAVLCGGCTPDALRICHGQIMRREYPRGAENMIKKRVQMFHDTAQEWCTTVDEFIETCDKKAPMLCRSLHVNF